MSALVRSSYGFSRGTLSPSSWANKICYLFIQFKVNIYYIVYTNLRLSTIKISIKFDFEFRFQGPVVLFTINKLNFKMLPLFRIPTANATLIIDFELPITISVREYFFLKVLTFG